MKVDKERTIEFLKTIHPQKCPLCGSDKWFFGESIFCTNEYFPKGNSNEYIQTLPMIPLTCGVCGNTYLINAIVAGFTEAQTIESLKEEKGDK